MKRVYIRWNERIENTGLENPPKPKQKKFSPGFVDGNPEASSRAYQKRADDECNCGELNFDNDEIVEDET